MWENEPTRPQREALFQYEVIVGMMQLSDQGEAAWPDLYRKVNVEPLTVTYEEFSAPSGYDPPTIRRILQHLDLDHTIDIPLRGR